MMVPLKLQQLQHQLQQQQQQQQQQQHGVAGRAVSSYRGISIVYERNSSTVEKLQGTT